MASAQDDPIMLSDDDDPIMLSDDDEPSGPPSSARRSHYGFTGDLDAKLWDGAAAAGWSHSRRFPGANYSNLISNNLI